MTKINQTITSPFALLLYSVLLNLTLCIYFFGTFDVTAWIRSAGITNNIGLVKGYYIYSLFYPPLATVILWFFGKLSGIGWYPSWVKAYPVAQQIGISYIPFKLAVLVFLYLTAAVIFWFLVKHKSLNPKRAVLYSSIIYLNPVYILSGPILGYIDIFFAPFLLSAFFTIESGYPYLAGLLLGTSFSIKLLPLLALPAFLAYFIHFDLKKKNLNIKIKPIIYFILGTLTVVLPLIFIFGYGPVKKVFDVSLLYKIYLSNDATNLNFILKTILNTNTTPQVWIYLSRLIFYTVSLAFLIKLIISKRSIELLYKAVIGILLAYYVIVTGAHENHLFPAVAAATGLIVSSFSKDNLKIFINISLIFFLNLLVFYGLGQVLSNSRFISIIPPDYQQTKNTLGLVVSLYGIIYFVKYSISFLNSRTRFPNKFSKFWRALSF